MRLATLASAAAIVLAAACDSNGGGGDGDTPSTEEARTRARNLVDRARQLQSIDAQLAACSAGLRDSSGRLLTPPPDQGLPLTDAEMQEAACWGQVINSIQTVVGATSSPPAVRRGFHAKSHGCLSGTLHVLTAEEQAAALPPEISSFPPAGTEHGVFANRGRDYDAWVRFSNGVGEPDYDLVPDVRGMAIKVLDVEGTRLVPTDTTTVQDFLMTNLPGQVAADPLTFMQFSAAQSQGPTVLLRYLGAHPAVRTQLFPQTDPSRLGSLLQADLSTLLHTLSSDSDDAVLDRTDSPPRGIARIIGNIGSEQFWSDSPYLLGDTAQVRFTAYPTPCNDGDELPPRNPVSIPALRKNYLRERLQAWARDHATCYTFAVQFHQDGEPINDSSAVWHGSRIPVARLTMEPQVFDTDERNAACEQMRFTPWQGVVAHQPIGEMNRARLAVYAASAMHRRATGALPSR